MTKSHIADIPATDCGAAGRGRRTVGLLASTAVACMLASVPLMGCQSEETAAPEAQQGGQTAVDSMKMRGAAEGYPAPDAPLTLLDGSQKNVSDFQGGVTILSFWATWCPYCIKEMPDLQKVKENYPDTDVVLVNCGEEEALVSDFVAQHDYDFTWTLDPDFAAQRAYPTSGIPYTVVIDSQGTVAEIFAGSGPDMYSKFEEAVKKAAAA